MKIAKKVIAAVLVIALLAGFSVMVFADDSTVVVERREKYDDNNKGLIAFALVIKNASGFTGMNLDITYDDTVLEYKKGAIGSDSRGLDDEGNYVNCLCVDKGSGLLKLAAYTDEPIPKTGNQYYNVKNFEFYILYFELLDDAASKVDFKVEVTISWGIELSGGTYTIKLKDEPATEPESEPKPTEPATEPKPTIAIERREDMDMNGEIAFAVVLKDAIGLIDWTCTIAYDKDIVEYAAYRYGADAEEVRNKCNRNSITCNQPVHSSGEVKCSGKFTLGLMTAQLFYADSWNPKNPARVNAEAFEAQILYFDVNDKNAYNVDFRVTINSCSGVDLSGGTYTIKLKEEPATEPETEPKPTEPATDDSTVVVERREKYDDNNKGLIAFALVIKNASDFESMDLKITYDDTVLEYKKGAKGSDSRELDNEDNTVSCLCKDKGSGLLYLAANTLDPIPEYYNENFEFYILYFELLDDAASKVDFKVEVVNSSGIRLSGGTYTIKLKDEPATEPETEPYTELVTEPHIWYSSDIHKIKDVFVYVLPGVKAKDLSESTDWWDVYSENGQKLPSDSIVGTGMILKYANYTYHIVVIGDATGDGAVTAEDARYALRAAVDLETPNDWQKEACLVSGNAKVTAEDARQILRVAVGLETLRLT